VKNPFLTIAGQSAPGTGSACAISRSASRRTTWSYGICAAGSAT
jgi:hypothetical protein